MDTVYHGLNIAQFRIWIGFSLILDLKLLRVFVKIIGPEIIFQAEDTLYTLGLDENHAKVE